MTFRGTGVGIATLGTGMGLPMMVMTAAGGVILGAAIEEIKREFEKNRRQQPQFGKLAVVIWHSGFFVV